MAQKRLGDRTLRNAEGLHVTTISSRFAMGAMASAARFPDACRALNGSEDKMLDQPWMRFSCPAQ
jgi:hypothetical protein